MSEIPDPADDVFLPLFVNDKQGETARSFQSNQNKNTLDLLSNIITMLTESSSFLLFTNVFYHCTPISLLNLKQDDPLLLTQLVVK